MDFRAHKSDTELRRAQLDGRCGMSIWLRSEEARWHLLAVRLLALCLLDARKVRADGTTISGSTEPTLFGFQRTFAPLREFLDREYLDGRIPKTFESGTVFTNLVQKSDDQYLLEVK